MRHLKSFFIILMLALPPLAAFAERFNISHDMRRTVKAMLLLLTVGIGMSGCSHNEFDPNDYYVSLISGDYGKGSAWNLTTIVNGDTIDGNGVVRFYQKANTYDADIKFINVIPGESTKEFKNIPIEAADDGLVFSIDYNRKAEKLHISGNVSFGEMTVDINLSE